MKKIIKLTESDLTRIVRRVINEQGDNLDSQLISCLKNKGYKSIDTEGKYRYMFEKEKILSSTLSLILTISSNDNKNIARLTITDYNWKVLYSGNLNITSELLRKCQFYQQVEVAYEEALKKASPKRDQQMSSDPTLVKQLLSKGFEKTRNPNIFRKDDKMYVSIYEKSIGAVCFKEQDNGKLMQYTTGNTGGTSNIDEAITQAKIYSAMSMCKRNPQL